MTEQLYLSFNNHDELPSSSEAAAKRRKKETEVALLKRAVMVWLDNGAAPPTGLADDVPTRMCRFKADIGAFVSKPVRNSEGVGPGYLLEPQHTTIVLCYSERSQCWNDCTNSENIIPQLKAAKDRKRQLQSQIRNEEPELRESNTLFEEFADWRYEQTQNARYHKVQREIENMENALYAGTRFEQLRQAQVADYLYLAVPAGMINADELADGWGLLWVLSDLSVSVKRTPNFHDCSPCNRVHFIQNIAAASRKSVEFVNGLRHSNTENRTYFVKPPRGHRKEVEYRVERITKSEKGED